jgi:predicted secreted protein
MTRHVSKSYAMWVAVLALAVALVALVASGCNSASDETTGGAETTTTVVDDSITNGGTTNGGTADDTTNGGTTEDTSAAAAAAATLALTEADNGKSYTVDVGDSISVVLAGNPTTGYLWESAMAEQTAPLLSLVGNEATYTPDSTDPNVVGSGGKYTFIFSADGAGQVELKLKYWRPFEAQSEPLQTFTVNLTIQ